MNEKIDEYPPRGVYLQAAKGYRNCHVSQSRMLRMWLPTSTLLFLRGKEGEKTRRPLQSKREDKKVSRQYVAVP